ncbi:diguanylate cyclase response regulator [Gammaproteobacteria bacterium 42_54_T18]|nr:diguanylate cyclase response regulator [Gammaproteobacteria bacterium 42_54_T18]
MALAYVGSSIPSILVVDDVPANVDILVEHLQYENVHLIVALNGEDAIDLACDRLPDLILLDIMMPGLNGYEVCSHLKSKPETMNIPVIFVTARGEDYDQEKGLALGAIDYIAKPYNASILKARVRNHLAMKKKTDLLNHLASIDGLTNAPNRRYFDELLEHEWCRCQRAARPLSVIMIDVDNFKSYNDFYGHGKGDDCLRQIVSAMQAALMRPSDVLARYGGEEFVVMLPESTASQAMVVAEKLRRQVCSLAIPHLVSGISGNVSISLGVESCVPDRCASSLGLVERADKGLYRAKALGRNQCCLNASNAS